MLHLICIGDMSVQSVPNKPTGIGANQGEGAMEYIVQSVNPVLEPLVTKMVAERPERPAQYMADWLNEVLQVAPEVSTSEILRLKSLVKDLESKLRGAIHESDDDADDDLFVDEDDMLGELPEMMPKCCARPRHSVSAEAYGEWNVKQEFVPKVIAKTEDQKKRIRSVLQESFLFSSLEEKDFETVINAMSEHVLTEKTRIIQQGDDGDLLYVIESGECKCLIKQPAGEEELCVKTCKEGDAFGELALLYNTPRAASVDSVGPATLWALDRETFNHIVKDAAAKKRNLYETFLCSVELLSGMEPYERSKVADALRAESFQDGEYIVKQGEAGDKFYFIEEGEAVATKSLDADSPPQQVMAYKLGDYFGELALLQHEPRAANVVAKGAARVISLDRKSFRRLLGPLEDILQRNTSRYKR